jgi:sulfide:quinone oxidoreductase
VRQADEILERTFADYGVEVLREARVERVDWDVHALAISSPAGTRVIGDIDFAHAVPHYRAPAWIADAGLSTDPTPGLVDIDPETLRSRRHESIWAIGDAAALGIRSSGGALRKQVDVLSRNLAAAAKGKQLSGYDGYTVMPITVSHRKLMLNEVDRNGKASPSIPFIDPFKPRRSTWLFDRYGLPVVYFRRLLKGEV